MASTSSCQCVVSSLVDGTQALTPRSSVSALCVATWAIAANHSAEEQLSWSSVGVGHGSAGSIIRDHFAGGRGAAALRRNCIVRLRTLQAIYHSMGIMSKSCCTCPGGTRY